MKKILALLALTSFVSLTVLAEEPVKASCDSKKETKACCKKGESSGKSCCSKDAKEGKSCSKDAKSSGCSHDKAATEKKSDSK